MNNDNGAEMQAGTDGMGENEAIAAGGAGNPAGPPEEVVIPDNWETPIKDFISNIEDQNAKRAFFDKFKSLDSGYQRKFQELAGQRKEFEGDRSFLDGYRGFEKGLEAEHKNAILTAYGNVPNYMNALYQMDLMATRDPAKFLINFCQNNGISAENLSQVLSGDGYRGEADARSKQSFEQEVMDKVRREFENRQAREQLERFTGAKDDAGNSRYPHFESVRGVMASLSGAYPDKGLEDLYDMAIHSVPEIRQQIAAKEAQKANDLEKAKSAAGVKPHTPSVNGKTSKSWRAVASEAVNQEEY